jgi:lipopolysaccharide transport system permease protein
MQELVIEAGHAERQYWVDLWRYRELFYFLAWRDILIRYKQTVVGAAWAVIRPLLTMAVLSVVFGRLAKMPTGGEPYPLVVFCGLLPWQFFSTALAESGNSLIMNSTLISKVYFPRMTVPASSVMTSLVDLGISGVLLAILMLWYGQMPTPRIMLLPAFVLLAFAAAAGAGVWVSALMVRYRDVRFVIPFIVQFGLYISPVGFSSDAVPAQYRLLYSLNPIVGVIDGFRWAILRNSSLYWPGFLLSTAMVAWTLVFGVRYFRRTERTFADVI